MDIRMCYNSTYTDTHRRTTTPHSVLGGLVGSVLDFSAASVKALLPGLCIMQILAANGPLTDVYHVIPYISQPSGALVLRMHFRKWFTDGKCWIRWTVAT